MVDRCYCCIDAADLLPCCSSGAEWDHTKMGHRGVTPVLFLEHSWFFFFLHSLMCSDGVAGHAGLGEQRAADAVTLLRADTALLWSLWPVLWAEAAVPEPTLEEHMGNGEMGPLSYVITGTQTVECVFVHASVCVCLWNGQTDWLTVNPPTVCMICPILQPATLCKQHFSGPEESPSQEVSTSQYEQDVGETEQKRSETERGSFEFLTTTFLTFWQTTSVKRKIVSSRFYWEWGLA